MHALFRFFASRAATLIPWLGRLSTLLMLALLAWLCASIYWTISTPATVRPAGNIDTDIQRVTQSIASRHLFGIAPTITATAAKSAASAPSDIKLQGVIAAQKEGQTAYALLSIEGKSPLVVHEGDEFAPGITLKKVLPREVEILRGGQSLTLSLPEAAKR